MSGHVHCCDEVDAEAAWKAGYAEIERLERQRAQWLATHLVLYRAAEAVAAYGASPPEYPGLVLVPADALAALRAALEEPTRREHE